MNARDLTIHFSKEWSKRYGGDPYAVSWKKDPAMLKRLIEFYGAEKVQRMITYFLTEHKSPFAEKAGHRLEVFVAQVPELIAALAKEPERKPSVNPDFERLQKARNENT